MDKSVAREETAHSAVREELGFFSGPWPVSLGSLGAPRLSASFLMLVTGHASGCDGEAEDWERIT